MNSTTHCIHPGVPVEFFNKIEGRMIVKSPQDCADISGLDAFDENDTDTCLALIGLLWAQVHEIKRLERADPVRKAQATARAAETRYKALLADAEKMAAERLAETAAAQ